MTTPGAGGPWNPEQYARFAAERERPFEDLLALVTPTPGMRCVDLGCGSGELTRRLHQRLSANETVGVDSSAEMLAKSAGYTGGGVSFARGALEGYTGTDGPFDLVFSNAAIHWVEDHPALLARLAALVVPGGQIAIQVPDMDGHASHATARAIALEEPFAAHLPGGGRISPVLAPERYASLLFRLGFTAQTVRLQIYGHPLESREAVVEWVKGTLLTDYQKRLPGELWPGFLARYRESLMEKLPDERPFFYPYRRILMWGRKTGPG